MSPSHSGPFYEIMRDTWGALDSAQSVLWLTSEWVLTFASYSELRRAGGQFEGEGADRRPARRGLQDLSFPSPSPSGLTGESPSEGKSHGSGLALLGPRTQLPSEPSEPPEPGPAKPVE